jgi:hypothetical protein
MTRGGDVSLPQTWQLRQADTVIARFTVVDSDFPWLHARVEATPDFEQYRPLFDEELRALNEEAWERFDAANQALRASVQLHYPDGRRVPEYILHVEGDVAWWRWADEPFDDEPDVSLQ